MNKVLRLSIFCSTMIAILLLSIVIVKADGVWYDTTIMISHNFTLNGQDRDYSYDNYRLDIIPSFLEEGVIGSGKVNLTIKLIRPLYRLGIRYGTETKYEGITTFDVSNLGITNSTYAGNAGKGKRYFYFSTYGNAGAGYGSLQGTAKIYNYS